VKLWVVGGFAMVGLAGLPTLAAADGPPLGTDGQFVLSAERLIGVSHTWATRPGDMMGPQTTSTNNVTILSGTPAGSGLGGFLPVISFTFPRVAADYFVTWRLSLGAAVGYFHSSNPGVTSSTTLSASGFMLDPRAGLVFPVTANVTIWLRAGLSFLSASVNDGTIQLLDATVEAPLTLTFVPHVALSIGPTIDVGIAGHAANQSAPNGPASDTEVGLQAGVLGIF
jgi:hypothetical protein